MDSEDLLKECNYSESELLEFKVDNKDPERTGKSISALEVLPTLDFIVLFSLSELLLTQSASSQLHNASGLNHALNDIVLPNQDSYFLYHREPCCKLILKHCFYKEHLDFIILAQATIQLLAPKPRGVDHPVQNF